MPNPISYKNSGVDIDATDALKRRMAETVGNGDARILNHFGAFAPVVDGRFAGIDDPVLIVKTDEPGSKQKLAFELDRIESICFDLINHTINDVVVMGAHPMYVTDCIVGGSLDSDVVHRLVRGMSQACEEQGAVLIGGETSIQPGVVQEGVYVLSATVIGVAERSRIIDGGSIQEGQAILGVASNGLHTNGYTLVRALLEAHPELARKTVASEGASFIDVMMRPHLCYFRALRELFSDPGLHGMSHVTGGGIRDNLVRILPDDADAVVDLGAYDVLEVFKVIRELGRVSDDDMLRTFNLGIGLVLVCDEAVLSSFSKVLATHGMSSYRIGHVEAGSGHVRLQGTVEW